MLGDSSSDGANSDNNKKDPKKGNGVGNFLNSLLDSDDFVEVGTKLVKGITNTGISGKGKGPCQKGHFHCHRSNKCLAVAPFARAYRLNPKLDFLCDGRCQCPDCEDEDFKFCKSSFPKEATEKCLEAHRPNRSPVVEILAIRCNGNKECKDGRDEHKCNVSLKVLLWLLSIGFGFISLTGGIL